MPITKRDVLELRKRFTKKSCTFQQMSGCYVSGEKQILLEFQTSFAELTEDETMKYLEIAKKVLSGTLGNHLLELSFETTEASMEKQQFLWALKSSQLKNPEQRMKFYEQVIKQYEIVGNYLILLFYDVYDVLARTSDGKKLDESEETYEYCIGAICPVTLSKPGLGYQKEQNRIGICVQDWIVEMPQAGFLYPAFCEGSSDSNTVQCYFKNPKESHPEWMEQILGCSPKRTASEQKILFTQIVTDAFGAEEEQAKDALFQIQRNLSELVQVQEDFQQEEALTTEQVVDILAEVSMPDDIRKQIAQEYIQEFAEQPPIPKQVFDAKMAETGIQRAQTMALQNKVLQLQQMVDLQHSEDIQEKILSLFPQLHEEDIQTQTINGKKFLFISME